MFYVRFCDKLSLAYVDIFSEILVTEFILIPVIIHIIYFAKRLPLFTCNGTSLFKFNEFVTFTHTTLHFLT